MKHFYLWIIPWMMVQAPTAKAQTPPPTPTISGSSDKQCVDAALELTANMANPDDYTFQWQYEAMPAYSCERNTRHDAFENSYLIQSNIEFNGCTDAIGIPLTTDQKRGLAYYMLSAVNQLPREGATSYESFEGTVRGYLSGLTNLSENELSCLNASVFSLWESYDAYAPLYDCGVKRLWAYFSGSTKVINFTAKNHGFNITAPTNITFRVRAQRKSDYTYSDWSVPISRNFLPQGPAMQVELLSRSCSKGKTGRIKIKNITSPVATNRFMYRIGGNWAGCEIKDSIDELTVSATDPSKCNWTGTPKRFTGYETEIDSVSAGDVRVYLTYQDSTVRNCFTVGRNVLTLPVQPASLDPLSAEITHVKNVSCYEGDDGRIVVKASGGSGQYDFKPSGTHNALLTELDTKGTYSGLSVGDYTIKVTDRVCTSEENTANITITQPDRAQITNKDDLRDGKEYPDCNGSPNGKIPKLITNIANIEYRLNGALQSDNQEDWINSLPGRDHVIAVKNKSALHCDGDFFAFTLQAAQPLEFEHDKIEEVSPSCDYLTNGFVAADGGIGGSGGYSYRLYRISDDQSYQPQSNLFSNLTAGAYRLTLKNNNNCPDSVTYSVNLLPPKKLTASLAAEDVRCYGERNGMITRSVVGDAAPDVFRWQKYNENFLGWEPRDEIASSLTSMSPGTYRLVTDYNTSVTRPTCRDTSNTVTVNEPDASITGTAALHDIRCFGEKGRFTVHSHGGNDGIHTFRYDAGSGFLNFPADSLFGAGIYAVDVTDRKGCRFLIASGMEITAPSIPLSFTHAASDFNGFNISCFGNDDGRIDIFTSGGNGASYSGYTYELNTLSQAIRPSFEKLTAGNYLIKVRDGRGCESSRNMTMTQPASGLIFNTPVIRDVICRDHTDGSITLSSSGGTAPFAYRIGGEAYVDNELFGGLGVGEYDFAVRDVNGCTWTEKFSVINTVPEMIITGTVADVNCFGGNDGRIGIGLSGGRVPIVYRWKETQSTEKDATGLMAGNHTLRTFDGAGCIAEKGFTVNQPAAALSFAVSTKPVCAGTNLGFVRPRATYGTPPYRYALDNKNDLVFTDEFAAAAGVHRVYVSDANNCADETSVEVEVKNRMPSINFVAATDRYATDTLILKEVSVPKPDSVRWSLPSEIVAAGGDEFSPVVIAPYSGEFVIRMTGWFEGCDYVVDKPVRFSDFDPTVIPENNKQKGIASVETFPNPSSGEFKIKVTLHVKQRAVLRITDIASGVWMDKTYVPCMTLEEDVHMGDAPSGVYILTIIAEHDAKSVRIVIQK